MSDSQLQHPDIEPETGWSRSIVRLIARAVSKARSGKPTSWCLIQNGDAAVLHVGKRNVCVMTPEIVELFVNVNAVDRLKLQNLGVTTKEMENHWFPGDGKMKFSTEIASDIVELIASNYLNAVSEVSRISAATNKRQLHDECLRQKLNEIGGVNITSPGYSGYKTLRQLNCG